MIGGKVLDPSALAAQAQGSIAMETWLAVSVPTGLVLYLPELAAAEAQAVYPGNERLVLGSKTRSRGLTWGSL